MEGTLADKLNGIPGEVVWMLTPFAPAVDLTGSGPGTLFFLFPIEEDEPLPDRPPRETSLGPGSWECVGHIGSRRIAVGRSLDPEEAVADCLKSMAEYLTGILLGIGWEPRADPAHQPADQETQ